MCIAICCWEGARPSEETLETAARTNRDGAGIAWPEMVDGEPKIRWEKGLDVEGIKKLSAEVPHPCIVHFRAQSTGSATDNLTHPFPISPRARDDTDGIADRVLFHNGTVPDWEDIYKSFIASRRVTDIPPYGTKRMSDTRAMAYMVYHMRHHVEGVDPKLKAENILQVFGERSRWAILDAEDALNEDSPYDGIRYLGDWWYSIKVDSEEEANLLYEEDGELYEGGLLFSNRSWKTTAQTT